MSRKNSESGFTLIELLTTVSILGVLSAIAVPQFAGYRNNALVARVQSDLKHFAMAEEAYFVDNETFTSCTNETCANVLPSIRSLSPGVSIEIISTVTEFTASAGHPQLEVTCRWDSSLEGFVGCT